VESGHNRARRVLAQRRLFVNDRKSIESAHKGGSSIGYYRGHRIGYDERGIDRGYFILYRNLINLEDRSGITIGCDGL